MRRNDCHHPDVRDRAAARRAEAVRGPAPDPRRRRCRSARSSSSSAEQPAAKQTFEAVFGRVGAAVLGRGRAGGVCAAGSTSRSRASRFEKTGTAGVRVRTGRPSRWAFRSTATNHAAGILGRLPVPGHRRASFRTSAPAWPGTRTSRPRTSRKRRGRGRDADRVSGAGRRRASRAPLDRRRRRRAVRARHRESSAAPASRKEFGEDNLGGTAVRVKVLVGR